MKSHQIAYIIVSFVLAATFISVFFFTYVSKIEADIIKTQISNVIENFVDMTNIALNESQKKQIGKIINDNLIVPDMSSQDRDAENTNKDLAKKTFIIFGILGGVGFLTVLLMFFIWKFNILDILKYSFLMLILVALTETLFVTFVTKNYKLIDENYVTYLIVNNLENYKNS